MFCEKAIKTAVEIQKLPFSFLNLPLKSYRPILLNFRYSSSIEIQILQMITSNENFAKLNGLVLKKLGAKKYPLNFIKFKKLHQFKHLPSIKKVSDIDGKPKSLTERQQTKNRNYPPKQIRNQKDNYPKMIYDQESKDAREKLIDKIDQYLHQKAKQSTVKRYSECSADFGSEEIQAGESVGQILKMINRVKGKELKNKSFGFVEFQIEPAQELNNQQNFRNFFESIPKRRQKIFYCKQVVLTQEQKNWNNDLNIEILTSIKEELIEQSYNTLRRNINKRKLLNFR